MKQELGRSVRSLGSPPDSDMPALIAGADFLALVSLYEGFGHPVLEAMACKTPSLISNRRPLTDLAGPAGFPVDPLDVDDIACAVLTPCSRTESFAEDWGVSDRNSPCAIRGNGPQTGRTRFTRKC